MPGRRSAVQVRTAENPEWHDCGEGPFPSAAAARRFAEAEVGVEWRVVPAPDATPASTPPGPEYCSYGCCPADCCWCDGNRPDLS